MKNKRKLYFNLFIICIFLIGITYAYFVSSNTIINKFNTKKFETTTYESFTSPSNWSPGDTIPKMVYVTNDGNMDAAVRISYTENWISKDGEELSNIQNDETIASINLVNENDWFKYGDYFYYKYRLPVGETTTSFMDSVTFNSDLEYTSVCNSNNGITDCKYTIGDYDGATYNLNIKIETIQYKSYKDIWNVAFDLKINRIPSIAETLIKKANSDNNLTYSTGDTHEMFIFQEAKTSKTKTLNEYRYIGNNPYNYVKFNCDDDGENCEIWRIIGVFDVDDGNGNIEKRVKLISGNTVFSSEWDNENNWSTSKLKTYLNNDYYYRLNDASTYGLKNSTHELISPSKFYLGGNNTNNSNTISLYNWERGVNTHNDYPDESVSKIGLMYPSDEYMVYAKGVNDICYNSPKDCNLSDSINGWIFNSNMPSGSNTINDIWLISHYNDSNNQTFGVSQTGSLNYYSSNSTLDVRPVVYLSNNVYIKSGTGKIDDPYKLSKQYTAAEYLIKNASNEEGATYDDSTKYKMFAFNHPATAQTPALTDYRYIGDNPKNYVKFNCDEDGENCETWRIIGVFNSDDGTGHIRQRVKLIREKGFNTKKQWNSTDINNWSSSSLNSFLNDDYYNRTGDAASFGIKDFPRTMIYSNKYYLGGRKYDGTTRYGTTDDMYDWERGTQVYNGNPTYYISNIGLIYPSDFYYIFSNGITDYCFNYPGSCFSNLTYNWLFLTNTTDNSGVKESIWTLSTINDNSYAALYVYSGGTLYSAHTNTNFLVRPVLYLKHDVSIIDGNGDLLNPYVLSY